MNPPIGLLPGDVVLFHGSRFLSRLIRRLTRLPGESETWANHVGFVVEAGMFLDATVQEAVNTVRRVSLRKYRDKPQPTSVRIYRPISIGPRDVAAILSRADETLGQRYGYGKLLLHALDSGLGWIRGRDSFVFRRFGFGGRPICSFDLADCFQSAGLAFGVEPAKASPDDIDDFCAKRTDHYELIYAGRV